MNLFFIYINIRISFYIDTQNNRKYNNKYSKKIKIHNKLIDL